MKVTGLCNEGSLPDPHSASLIITLNKHLNKHSNHCPMQHWHSTYYIKPFTALGECKDKAGQSAMRVGEIGHGLPWLWGGR